MILLTSPEIATDRAEISVYGDLDVTTGVELRRVLGALTAVNLELDLAHVTFLDCAGVRTLPHATRPIVADHTWEGLLTPSRAAAGR